MSKVFTLGYTAHGADERLDCLMADPSMLLIDIRLSPKSRLHSRFRGPVLEQRFDVRYKHVPEFGNLNCRDRALPIVLADPVIGVSYVSICLQRGFSVCLLCACSNAASCHRSVVAHLLMQHNGCEVIHL